MKSKHLLSSILFVLIVASLALSACAPAAATTQAPASTQSGQSTAAPAQPSGQAVTIRYVLWDSAQQPAYEACAKAFTAKNPNITVKIEQSGWNDYWTAIQTAASRCARS